MVLSVDRVWERTALTIIIIIANHDLLNFPVLAHFTPKILIEGIEVVLQLTWIHLVLRIVCRVLV
jgi:hypothetical protein